MDLETIRKATNALLGKSVRPMCAYHQPEAVLVRHDEGLIVEITCPNCNFLGYAHPDSI
jgi:hypothetical protein